MAKLDIDEVTRRYFSRIHRAALVLTGNPWDADDLAQETFLVLANQADRFEGRSSTYTWLYGILLNLDRRDRRRHGMRRKKLQVLWDRQPKHERTAPGADNAVVVAEWKQSLWSLVDRLPDGQRQALVLRFSEGMRYDEIAAVLECPLGTVKSRIFHGLAALKRLIEVEGEQVTQVPEHTDEDISDAI